jgi:hypothetical protein
VFAEDAKPILGVADTRLNKEGKGLKIQSRGLARLAVPLKKSLRCAPPARAKPVLPKKLVPDAGVIRVLVLLRLQSLMRTRRP